MQSNFSKISLFISAIFFCVFLFVFLYFYKEINNNNKESQLAKTQWQTEALRRNEIKTLDHSVKIIEKERMQIETHFAKSSDIVPFLDTIEGLGSQAGALAEIISVDILKDYAGLVVGMKASGTFEDLYKFLTLLENSPYELEFISMDMNRGTELGVSSENVKISKWNAVFNIKLLSFIQ